MAKYGTLNSFRKLLEDPEVNSTIAAKASGFLEFSKDQSFA